MRVSVKVISKARRDQQVPPVDGRQVNGLVQTIKASSAEPNSGYLDPLDQIGLSGGNAEQDGAAPLREDSLNTANFVQRKHRPYVVADSLG